MSPQTNNAMPSGQPSRAAFFYGTLMAPSVLHRVTNIPSKGPRDPSKPPLQIRPAILPGFRRHRVKYADYPAIVPVVQQDPIQADPQAKNSMASEVRGTYVTGLVPADILRLDAFEGSQYERQFVRVRLLPEPHPAQGQGQVQPESAAPAAAAEDGGEWATAETYVFISSLNELEDLEWDFDEFVREKLWMWAGGQGDSGFEDAAKAGEGADKENAAGSDPTGGRSVNGGEFEKMMAERERGE